MTYALPPSKPISMLIVAVAGLSQALPIAAFADDPIQEIVITATKRPAPLQHLAGNAASLDQGAIDALSADHISEALNQLPGVNVQHANGQEHLTSIRSPVLTAGAGAGSFLYMEDGIPLRSPGFANINGLFAAHTELAGRVEVVRGPGSALYGSNAVHGLINVLTRDPEAQESDSIDLSSGSHNQSSGKFSFARQLSPGAALGLSATLKHDDGYRDASGYDQQKLTFRFDRKMDGGHLTAVLSGHNLEQETAGYIKGFEVYKDEAIAKSNPDPAAFRNARALRGYVEWQHDISDGLTLSLTPYFRHTEMDFRMHFLPGQALEENGHSSLGLQARLYRTRDKSLIIAGVDTEVTDGFLKEVQAAPTEFSFVQGTHYDYGIEATSVSPFLHSEWQLTEKTRLTAGLRLDYTMYDYDNDTAADTVGRFQRVADRSDHFTTVTPKLGFTQEIDDEISLFGLYARGQRAPQTTDLYRLQSKQTLSDIEPETVESIELGLRDTIGALQWELTAYAMKKEHFFFRDSDGLNVSDGKTSHRGIEASLKAPFGRLFDIAGQLTYARHTYDFNNAVDANSTEDIVDGNDMDTGPKWLGNIRLGWVPVDNARLELEWVHMDAYYTDGSNTTEYEGHDLFNLRGSYGLNQRLTLYARVENLADTAYAERADYAFGTYRYFPGEQRSFFFGVRTNF